MAIFEFTANGILQLPAATFAELKLRERQDLQRALRDNISVITPDVETMVIAEEFGDWEEGRRRIDLLCLDSDCNLVVVELKRTEGGGHAELQAIRYAAMVSAMKFEQAVTAHKKYLEAVGRRDVDAEASIRGFLGIEDAQITFSTSVRIVLAALEFDREITTTVLWLKEFGLDIRCVQMRPYALGDRTLLDIQQVIPLPQAEAYQIAVREKALEKKISSREDGRDFTKFDLRDGDEEYFRLKKRWFIFRIVKAAIRRGMTPQDVAKAAKKTMYSMFYYAEGVLDGIQFKFACSDRDVVRSFCEDDQLFHIDGKTFALSRMWGGKEIEESADAILDALGNPDDLSYQVAM